MTDDAINQRLADHSLKNHDAYLESPRSTVYARYRRLLTATLDHFLHLWPWENVHDRHGNSARKNGFRRKKLKFDRAKESGIDNIIQRIVRAARLEATRMKI